MSRHVFTVKPGFDRVQAGADPRIEITPAKPYTTDDPILVAELRANPFLNVKTPTTSTKRAPAKTTKPKPAAAPVPAPAASDGGAS